MIGSAKLWRQLMNRAIADSWLAGWLAGDDFDHTTAPHSPSLPKFFTAHHLRPKA
jgi:hypothetical protein